ncbi:MAG: CDP-alcohol phosphatidyltransferase family protein [Phycisphaerae bacterium]|nr:CDP-alcohol phosphatidyltransferase family protein [Phycisphaerae bacterium]
MVEEITNRRPIKARNAVWASKIASSLVRLKIRPNTISLLSIVFALLSGVSFAISSSFDLWGKSVLLFLGAGFIQCRLLCNLFDGMVAIEGGTKSKSGEVFNDFPDRLADPLILIGIGYALRGLPFAVELGWLAGMLAVMTAYVRYLGTAAGAGSFFWGPMAKQHRMAVATIASVLQGIAVFWYKPLYLLYAGLVIIVVGCIITVFKRVMKIVRILEQSS